MVPKGDGFIMVRTHPLYLAAAIIFAIALQYLLVRRMNRSMEAKHGEDVISHDEENNP